jgi:hypothetical protein
MRYHVARTAAKPGEIWGHRITNLRDAMETAEELTHERGEAHTVWEMKALWTAERGADGNPLDK